MHVRSGLFLLFILGVMSPLSGVDSKDSSNIRFKTYTVDDGLMTNSVAVIFQDSRGLLWLGTQDGLNLFDGTNFTTLGVNSPLSGGYIHDIDEGFDDTILIASSTGLYRYDMETDLLEPFHENLMDYEVLDVCALSPTDVVVSLRGRGVFRFSSGGLTPLIQDIKINDILVVGSRLFAATDKGLILYELNNAGVMDVYRPESRILSLAHDGDVLYAGTDRGVLSLHMTGSITEFFPLTTEVSALIPGGEKGLWLGTGSQGLFLKNHDFSNNGRLGEKGTVLSLFLDRSDNLWIGFLGLGLKKIDIHRLGFSYLGRSDGLDNTIVVSLWEEEDGSLLVGTFGGGLYHFSARGRLANHQERIGGTGGSTADNRIMSLYRDSRGFLWAGTKGSGLFRAGDDDFIHVDGSYSSVYTIQEDRYGRIWAVTQGGGVHLINSYGEIEKTLEAPVLPTLTFRTMLISGDRVYLGSADNGLIVLDLEGNLVRHYNPEDREHGLHGAHIMSIFMSSDGTLWVGTSGGGLHRYNSTNDSFDQYTTENGLPNNTVYGILEDHDKRLWISTNKGLAVLYPETMDITVFTVADGLQSNEFNSGAALSGRNSTLYMGGVNGLTYFDPDSLTRNDTAPETLLTGVSINNRQIHVGETVHNRVLIPRALNFMDELELTRDELVVTLDFKALHFSAPQNNSYAYYLEGLESDWNYTGTSIHSTYTNLSPGSYLFHYKAANAYGVWSQDKSIALVVKPKFYEYLIFKVGMAILLVTFILIIILLYLSKTEEKNLMLENRVRERTKELEEALSREKKRREILSIGEKMSSLVSLTLRLSHNLNTPLGSSLTAVSYLKDHLERSGADGKLIECCNLAMEGTKQAVSIVQQLSFASNAQVFPTPVMFNLSAVIREYIGQSWTKTLETSNIECLLDLPEIERFIMGSISALQETLDSLIRNSLYHGFKGKEETTGNKISIKVVYSEKEALIVYRDNGIGIDDSVLTKIFEPFERGKGPGTGSSGMGLFLVYNLIRLQFSGSISCIQENEGACFHIRLPLLEMKKV